MKKKIIILFLAMIAAAGTVNAKPVKYLKCGCTIIEGSVQTTTKCGECGKTLYKKTWHVTNDKYGQSSIVVYRCEEQYGGCKHEHTDLDGDGYGRLKFDYLPADETVENLANHVHTTDKCIAVGKAEIKDEKNHSTGYFMVRVTNRCPACANGNKPIVFEIPGKTKKPVTLYYGNKNSWESINENIKFPDGTEVVIKLSDR